MNVCVQSLRSYRRKRCLLTNVGNNALNSTENNNYINDSNNERNHKSDESNKFICNENAIKRKINRQMNFDAIIGQLFGNNASNRPIVRLKRVDDCAGDQTEEESNHSSRSKPQPNPMYNLRQRTRVKPIESESYEESSGESDIDSDVDPEFIEQSEESDDYSRVTSGLRPFRSRKESSEDSSDNRLLKSRHFRCYFDECDYQTSDKEEFAQHLSGHSDGRPFVCPTKGCAMRFKTKRNRKCHQMSKHSPIGTNGLRKRREYSCKLCSKTFGSYSRYRYHSLTVHQSFDRPIACRAADCGKSFGSRHRFNIHQRRVHSAKHMRCDHLGCDYTTSNKDYMSFHVLKHSDVQPFVCTVNDCRKGFRSEYLLKRHLKVHGSQRIECSYKGCGHAFKCERYYQVLVVAHNRGAKDLDLIQSDKWGLINKKFIY